MSQFLLDLEEAINIIATARMACTGASPYGWDKNYSAYKYLRSQLDKHLSEAA